ncbi:MAG: hypothetical protein KF842_03880 [Caulobacter sp.]|nr:hypothetical protein [Caulobacter sp.]
MTPQTPTPDAQDRAETFDETHLNPDGVEIANFDTMPDVYDATSKPGDGDRPPPRDDQGLRALGERRSFADPEERVTDEAASPADYEANATPGTNKTDKGEKPEDPADHVEKDNDPHVEKQLDKGLKETFPASDPVSINPGAD